MKGHSGTPVPSRVIERQSTGSGPVITYTLSPEEMEAMGIKKDGPACGLTKEALLEAIASGETLSSIERAWGMKYNTIHTWVKTWGLKGINQETARELLAVTEPSQTSDSAPVTQTSTLDAEKEAEIEQLRYDKKYWKSKAEEAIAYAGESAEKHTAEKAALQEENVRLKDQLTVNDAAIRVLKSECNTLYNEREEYRSKLENRETEITEPLAVVSDPVNHPSHYNAGKIECIDALEAATEGLIGIEAVCTGNAIKYLWRWKRKGGIEDLKKARWYLDRLIGGKDQGGENDAS